MCVRVCVNVVCMGMGNRNAQVEKLLGVVKVVCIGIVSYIHLMLPTKRIV